MWTVSTSRDLLSLDDALCYAYTHECPGNTNSQGLPHAQFSQVGGSRLALPLANVWFLGGPAPCSPPKKSQKQVENGALGRPRPRSLEGGAGG